MKWTVPLIAALGLVLTAPLVAANGSEPVRHCGMVVFTPNSGDGAFDISARGISCTGAKRAITKARGRPSKLTGWKCRLLFRYRGIPSGRYKCTNRALVHGQMRERALWFTEGN